MQVSKLLSVALTAGALALQGGYAHALTVHSSASASGTRGTSSTLGFSGGSGTYNADGDKIVVKNGLITINGVSYGKVSEHSQIQYSIRDGKKILTVDGAVRNPVK